MRCMRWTESTTLLAAQLTALQLPRRSVLRAIQRARMCWHNWRVGHLTAYCRAAFHSFGQVPISCTPTPTGADVQDSFGERVYALRDNSSSVGMRPSGVSLSMASGSSPLSFASS